MPATAPYNGFPQTRTGAGLDFTLNFKDANGVAVSRSSDVFKAYFYASASKRAISDASLTLTEGSGLTNSGTSLVLALTVANVATIEAGDNILVFESTPSGGKADAFLVGPFKIGRAGELPETKTASATTVTIGADTLTVEVEFSALSSIAAQSVLANATGSSAAPSGLAMGASTFLARLASGSIVAATVNESQTLLNAATGFWQWRKGVDIASAAPLVLGTDGNYFDVTGTTGFAAITVAAGTFFMLQFDGVLTLTHHATNLDLPGEANITTAAGDVFLGFATGANTVQCVGYTKADGTSVIGGAGSGDVSKVGTPVNDEIGVWTGDGTLEGDTNLQWDGSTLKVVGSITDDGVAVPTISSTSTLTNKSISGPQIDSGTIPAARVGAAHIDAITEIAAGLKSGADATLVTGTAGTSGDLSQWNADGDLVDGPTPPTGTIIGTTDTQTLTNKTQALGSNTFSGTTAQFQTANTDGTFNVVGKQTIYVPAAAMRKTVSNGCAAITDVETTSGRPDMQVLDFDASSDEHAQFQVAFPKSWNLSTVTYQAFWTSTATDTDGVAWALQGVAVANDGTIDVAYGTAVVVTDDNISAAEDLLVTAESGAVTIAGSPADDEMCFFRVFRDVSDSNDDMTEDARLIGIKFFFTTDSENDA